MDSSRQTEIFPTLVITGPVGVGKTTVATATSELLDEAGIPHARVDMDWLRWCHPSPAHDPFHTNLGMRNLAAVWQNYRSEGAERLIMVDAVETNDQLESYRSSVPGADIVVARLYAPIPTILRRLEGRETGSGLEWHRNRAGELTGIMERNGIGDFLVDTEGRAVPDIARELLHRAGWIAGDTPIP